MTTADHINAASLAAEDAMKEHANPAIQAAIAQAHALTAIALLLVRIADAIDEESSRAYTADSVRIFGTGE